MNTIKLSANTKEKDKNCNYFI